MQKHVLLPILVGVAVVAALFLFLDGSWKDSGSVPSATPCRELTNEEIGAIVGGFMKKQGYESYEIRTVSPLYCANEVGTRNIAVNAMVDWGLPTQHNKTVRLQTRSAAGEMKIYEVVLTNPG